MYFCAHTMFGAYQERGEANEFIKWADCAIIEQYVPHAHGYGPKEFAGDMGKHQPIVERYFLMRKIGRG